jgi:hypothetical protein
MQKAIRQHASRTVLPFFRQTSRSNSVLVPRAFLSSDRSSPHLAISGCESGGAENLSKQSRESDSFALNPETFTDNCSTLMIERSGQTHGFSIPLDDLFSLATFHGRAKF